MTTKNLLFITFTVLLFTLSGSAQAQSRETERIINFHSTIKIETDGKITVAENITVYAARQDIRRGIVRSIPLYRTDASGKREKMDFRVLSVKRNGEVEKWETETANNHKEIFIGDGDVMLTTGKHEYIVTYESYGHVGFFDTFDELYWNVTGNDWAFRIEQASATILLPGGASAINTACYTGREGSTASNCTAVSNDSTVTFKSNGALASGEGLTVAVSFPRDIIKRPPPPSRTEMFWEEYKNLICTLLFLAIMGCFYFFTWRKVGVDPEKPVVIPTFNPPHGWSAAVIRYLYKKGYDSEAFTVALISMAVNGGIRIKYENKKYQLEKTGIKTGLAPEEKKIYETLFNKRESILVSDKNHTTFSSANSQLSSALKKGWNIKDYFLYNTKYIVFAALLMVALLIGYVILTGAGGTAVSFVVGIPVIAIGLTLLVAAIRNRKMGCSNIILFIVGFMFAIPPLILQLTILFQEDLTTTTFLILMFASFVVYLFLIKAPTELGAQTEAELEGFRMYLKTAEENRLNLLTPPDRTPELFEHLLPYAIALNVENEWGKKFDDVLKQAEYQPDWYNDTRPLMYSMLAASLSSSLNASVSRAQIDPSVSSGSSGSGGWSSGSGGGGFSGGGGGGGGGRGW